MTFKRKDKRVPRRAPLPDVSCVRFPAEPIYAQGDYDQPAGEGVHYHRAIGYRGYEGCHEPTKSDRVRPPGTNPKKPRKV